MAELRFEIMFLKASSSPVYYATMTHSKQHSRVTLALPLELRIENPYKVNVIIPVQNIFKKFTM